MLAYAHVPGLSWQRVHGPSHTEGWSIRITINGPTGAQSPTFALNKFKIWAPSCIFTHATTIRSGAHTAWYVLASSVLLGCMPTPARHQKRHNIMVQRCSPWVLHPCRMTSAAGPPTSKKGAYFASRTDLSDYSMLSWGGDESNQIMHKNMHVMSRVLKCTAADAWCEIWYFLNLGAKSNICGSEPSQELLFVLSFSMQSSKQWSNYLIALTYPGHRWAPMLRWNAANDASAVSFIVRQAWYAWCRNRGQEDKSRMSQPWNVTPWRDSIMNKTM